MVSLLMNPHKIHCSFLSLSYYFFIDALMWIIEVDSYNGIFNLSENVLNF